MLASKSLIQKIENNQFDQSKSSRISKCITLESNFISLHKEHFFKKNCVYFLANAVHQSFCFRRNYCQFISLNLIENTIFDWLKDRAKLTIQKIRQPTKFCMPFDANEFADCNKLNSNWTVPSANRTTFLDDIANKQQQQQ